MSDEHPSGSIIRSPHDKKHPFTIISDAFLRDPLLHPLTKGLISYLLTMIDDWNINVAHLIKYFSPVMGRDAVYSMIKQACESPYMQRIESRNAKGHVIYSYHISEKPIFQKNSPHTAKPEVGLPEVGKPDTKELPSPYGRKKKQEEEYKKSKPEKDETDPKPTKIPNQAGPAVLPRPEASAVTSSFFESLCSARAQRNLGPPKPPDLRAWESLFEKAIAEGLAADRLLKAIEWLPTSQFWSKVIQSPKKLIEKLEALEMDMADSAKSPSTSSNCTEANSALLAKIRPKLERSQDIHIDGNRIQFGPGYPPVEIRVTSKNFGRDLRSQLAKRYESPVVERLLEG